MEVDEEGEDIEDVEDVPAVAGGSGGRVIPRPSEVLASECLSLVGLCWASEMAVFGRLRDPSLFSRSSVFG